MIYLLDMIFVLKGNNLYDCEQKSSNAQRTNSFIDNTVHPSLQVDRNLKALLWAMERHRRTVQSSRCWP